MLIRHLNWINEFDRLTAFPDESLYLLLMELLFSAFILIQALCQLVDLMNLVVQ